jgi:hypothetical protein
MALKITATSITTLSKKAHNITTLIITVQCSDKCFTVVLSAVKLYVISLCVVAPNLLPKKKMRRTISKVCLVSNGLYYKTLYYNTLHYIAVSWCVCYCKPLPILVLIFLGNARILPLKWDPLSMLYYSQFYGDYFVNKLLRFVNVVSFFAAGECASFHAGKLLQFSVMFVR